MQSTDFFTEDDIDSIKRSGINMEESDLNNYLVTIIDVGKRDIQQVDIRKIFHNELKSYIDFGFKFELNAIKDVEKFSKHYYTLQGYEVIRVTSNGMDINSNKERELIINYLKQQDSIVDSDSIIKAGVPDFLIYKLVNEEMVDIFFLEAKKKVDSLRYEQMLWIFGNKLPIKIMVI